MTTTGSIGGMLVWASQCLAFIRYRAWFRLFKDDLKDVHPRYDIWAHNNKERYMSILSSLQPLPAYFGLTATFLIVFVFSTATWWPHNPTLKKVATAYAGVSEMLSHLGPSACGFTCPPSPSVTSSCY